MQEVQRKTPGVYVTELNAFPPSIVGIETAIPAFIGYTEKANLSGESYTMKPLRIASLADFEEVFGKAPPAKFKLTEVSTPAQPPDPNKPSEPAEPSDIELGTGDAKKRYKIEPANPLFYLYYSLRLFYANGGGDCYVVSVDDFTSAVDDKHLLSGLDAIHDEIGPTMLVVPDALLLNEASFNIVIVAMLSQCGNLGDRVAILDVKGSDQMAPAVMPDKTITDLITAFRNGVGTEFIKYGMAYFPAVQASLVQESDLSLANLDVDSVRLLSTEVTRLFPNDKSLTDRLAAATTGAKALAKTNDEAVTEAEETAKDTAENAPTDQQVAAAVTLAKAVAAASPAAAAARLQSVDNDLRSAMPALKRCYAQMAAKLNILPTSGAMAGVYAQVDRTRGVWNAPANISLHSVVDTTFKITAKNQEDLNVPTEGKAINAIREFVGRGTLVWGARTLDGNSDDWRYIQVRRSLIYVEQSVKAALNQFVFAANDGNTWVAVTAMISNFLQGLWSQCGLLGATASEAFTVQCGLGTTMTGLDVLEGYMRVQVTLQMIHPAEFIELTFKQQMQGV